MLSIISVEPSFFQFILNCEIRSHSKKSESLVIKLASPSRETAYTGFEHDRIANYIVIHGLTLLF